jgi:sn-glycerol 3-phosphate transport system substrate-binding protein
MNRTTRRSLLHTVAAGLALRGVARAADTAAEISFYFPVAVGGPITRIIDGYAKDFQRENPTIKVTPIYAGSYQDTLTKAQTALKANAGPQMAVLLSTDAFSLIDDDLIVPFDTLAESESDRAWLRSFYPAFLRNGEIGGHTWGVPYQRSTIVLYWNKAAFQDADLDPERPPANWAEHAEFAQKLTRRSSGGVDRWGVQIPGSGFPYWLFQALATEAGATLANADGAETDFAAPGCI